MFLYVPHRMYTLSIGRVELRISSYAFHVASNVYPTYVIRICMQSRSFFVHYLLFRDCCLVFNLFNHLYEFFNIKIAMLLYDS